MFYTASFRLFITLLKLLYLVKAIIGCDFYNAEKILTSVYSKTLFLFYFIPLKLAAAI